MSEINNNEIKETTPPEEKRSLEIEGAKETEQSEEKNGLEVEDNDVDMKQYEWKLDENDQPVLDDDGNSVITCEYDEAEATLREQDRDFVKAWNTAASAGLDNTIDGLDSSGLVDSINDNDVLIDKEIDFGYGVAGTMRDMNGGITQTNIIKAKLEADLEATAEEIPEETAKDEQLEGQMKFEI